MRRISITVTVLALLVYAGYWLGSGSDPPVATPAGAPAKTTIDGSGFEAPIADADKAVESDLPVEKTAQPAKPVTRKLEIYGRISDSRGQPVEGALVTEDRFFFATTSDANGDYRIHLDLPPQRLPQIRVMRAGYAAAKLSFSLAEISHKNRLRADVRLSDDNRTLRLTGRIADELGIGLEGVRVEISSKPGEDEENFYLTVFSNADGGFLLEGVPGERHYRLSASLLPNYPIYRDPDLFIDRNPARLDITLQAFQFVTLAGMILNPDREPIANFEIFINNPASGRRQHRIVSDSSGFFTLREFPLGNVDLSTRGAEAHRISGLQLTETNYAGIELIVDRGEHQLEGWISGPDGGAMPRAMVTLDRELRIAGIESVSYRSQTTDDYGHFSFTGIARGAHQLSVYAEGYQPLKTSVDLRQASGQLALQLTRQR